MKLVRWIVVVSLLVAAGCKSEGSSPDGSAKTGGEETTREATEKTAEKTEEATEEAEPEPLELPQASTPKEGIVAAGQPTREQFARLSEHGFGAVINLRTLEESGAWDEAEAASEQELAYTHIPIAGPDDLNEEAVKKFAEALEQADGKVLVHCGSSNRVGAMLALHANWAEEQSAEEAIELGKKAGMSSLEPAVREKLK